MKIALDGFGGDHAPLAMLEGAALAVAEYGVEVVITGDESVLRKTALEHNISLAGSVRNPPPCCTNTGILLWAGRLPFCPKAR